MGVAGDGIAVLVWIGLKGWLSSQATDGAAARSSRSSPDPCRGGEGGGGSN